MYFDSHAHLTSQEFADDIDEVITRANRAGVDKIINVCIDEACLNKGLELKKKWNCIYNSAAVHPHDAEKEGAYFFPIVEKAAKEGKIVAIGESGLDYYYEHSSKKTQQEYLVRHFELAKQYQLPLIIHCREAFADLFTLIDQCQAVLHCFSGTLEEAKQVLEKGWLISFSGIITFKKSGLLREVVKYVPLDRMFIETDAPFLAPQSQRGKRCEPAFVVETAGTIAEVKGIELEEVARTTFQNALHFFLLNKEKG
jgi:TatD DNase family protein